MHKCAQKPLEKGVTVLSQEANNSYLYKCFRTLAPIGNEKLLFREKGKFQFSSLRLVQIAILGASMVLSRTPVPNSLCQFVIFRWHKKHTPSISPPDATRQSYNEVQIPFATTAQKTHLSLSSWMRSCFEIRAGHPKNNTRDFCLIICWSLLYIPLEMVMFLNDNLLTWDGMVCSFIWIILTEISGTCLWVEIHRIGLLLTLENTSEGLSLWVVSLCCLLSLWYHVWGP